MDREAISDTISLWNTATTGVAVAFSKRRVAMRCILAVLTLAVGAATVGAGDAPKKVLLVTHSGGFMHDSIGVAEEVLKKIGPKYLHKNDEITRAW